MNIRVKLIGDITLSPIIDRLKLLSNEINLSFDFVENLPSSPFKVLNPSIIFSFTIS